jgi:hypothetical protein
MSHWNLKRAARLGYLAGRGLSVESIMADHVIAARSERAVRCAAKDQLFSKDSINSARTEAVLGMRSYS